MINSAPVFTRVKLSPASSSRLPGHLSRVTLYTEAEKSHGDRFHYLFFQSEGRTSMRWVKMISKIEES